MAVATVAERQWEPITDFREADRVFTALDQRAREWGGIMAAAAAALTEVLAEVDARGLCEQFGFRSLEHWVTWTDPTPRQPRPPAPTGPPSPQPAPTVFDLYDFRYCRASWTPESSGGRSRRGGDDDSDDDVTYG